MKRNLDDNEFLVQCALKNSVISPDVEYANIQTNYGIMKNKIRFNPCFDKIACLVLRNIKTARC